LKEIARSYGNYMNIVCVSIRRIQNSFTEPHSKLQRLDDTQVVATDLKSHDMLKTIGACSIFD
jgi:hypothetical protein